MNKPTLSIMLSILLTSCATIPENEVYLDRGLPQDMVVIYQPDNQVTVDKTGKVSIQP